MRRSSKIILAIWAFIIIYFVMVYMQLAGQSRKDFTQADADTFLKELALAFEREDPSAVTSFAYPDAKVAGQRLKAVRNLLHQGFSQMRDPVVEYSGTRLTNDRSIAHVQTNVTVKDEGSAGAVRYSAPVSFKLERRSIPHLAGLIHVYDWKVVNVDAQMPTEAMIP